MAQADFGQGKNKGTAALVLAGILLLGGAAAPVIAPQSAPGAAMAQNLFAPRLYVNGEAITEYEVGQRAAFLQALRAPGNPETEALKALMEDKLRLSEAKRLKLKLTPAEVKSAMEEFAARAGMSADQLTAELAKAGIGVETYRDFVTAGALWRNLVRGRFGGRISVSEAEIDRALDASSRQVALKLQVSELVIPAEPGREAEAMALAENIAREVKTEAGFASAARQYSAAPSAENGGRLPAWLPVANLPPALAGQIIALSPGEVSPPVQVPGAVVLFQLRDIAKDTSAAPVAVNVEYADFILPDDPSVIAKIRNGADRCLDLYGVAKGLPEDVLAIKSATMGSVSQELGLALGRLDLNEIAVLPAQAGFKRLVMLCGRQAVMEEAPSRERVRDQILNQKLEGMAENYLEELRSAALIREP